MWKTLLTVMLLSALPVFAADTPCKRTEQCAPPATHRWPRAHPPLNAPVRFGGEVRRQGEVYWRWLRDGDPSRECTPAERLQSHLRKSCNVQVGEVLVESPRFKPGEVE